MLEKPLLTYVHLATTPTTNASSYGDIKELNDCTTTSMVGLTATLATAGGDLNRMHRYCTYGGNGVVIFFDFSKSSCKDL